MLQYINLLLCQNSFSSECTKTLDLSSVNYLILRWWEWSTAGWDINSGNLHGIADPLRDIAFRELQNNIETGIFWLVVVNMTRSSEASAHSRMIHTTAVSKKPLHTVEWFIWLQYRKTFTARVLSKIKASDWAINLRGTPVWQEIPPKYGMYKTMGKSYYPMWL